jgi:hypothetical protein
MDELIQTKPGLNEIKEYLGQPEIFQYWFCKPHSNPIIAAQEENPIWQCGAAMTILIVNTSEIWCANVGDCRAVMSTVRGTGKL